MSAKPQKPNISAVTERQPLFHSAGGTRLHLRYCSHFLDTAVEGIIEAAADDARPVCEWSKDEIDGVGQQRFDTLDEALEAYLAPVENRARMREVAAEFEYDKVWMPHSRSYVAIAQAGKSSLATFGKTYIWTPSGGKETLDGYVAGAGQSAGSQRQNEQPTCPTHHMTLPATGICDSCD